MKNRTASITRDTKETQITLELNLDGTGKYTIETPIGFLNHMLELFAKHGLFDLTIKAAGDTNYDDHHIIEDVGIVLGQAIAKALKDAPPRRGSNTVAELSLGLADKRGIKRYGSKIIPMDEVLCLCAIDLGGRFSFDTNYEPKREKVNDFPTEMMWHFFQSIAINALMNLHIQFLNPGKNEHHSLEAVFKSFARALREACEVDERAKNFLPSTKGIL